MKVYVFIYIFGSIFHVCTPFTQIHTCTHTHNAHTMHTHHSGSADGKIIVWRLDTLTYHRAFTSAGQSIQVCVCENIYACIIYFIYMCVLMYIYACVRPLCHLQSVNNNYQPPPLNPSKQPKTVAGDLPR